MTAIDRQRVMDLFADCVDLDAAARVAFLDSACADDAALRGEVEQLLAADAGHDPLADPIARSIDAWVDHNEPWRGRRVGAYRLLDVLGHGGMGSVFLAARDDDEYDARVAIKLIRGFPTPRALANLRRERQLLATLEHPGIARLLDGGTTPEGEPFLVIEYVDGAAVSEWCGEARPSLEARLRLVQALCEAVHHAHRHLVVHSDLKPANVLVRGDGRPVLLDFGIARLLDAGDVDSRLTATRAYTPMYASPEQIAGRTVTSASDVHALGLILFELLAGSPLRATGAADALPSRRAATATEAWIRADAARLRGDLDRVVAKATAAEPGERYDSAAALGLDLVRYLDGKPLEAAPDNRRYRIAKFVRRHAFASAAAALLVLAAIGFGSWLAAERTRALAAEQTARVEAATANRVTGFLLDLFRTADPETSRGREPTVREVLDDGRTRLHADLADQPIVRARLLAAIGEIYTSIGQPQSAVDALAEAVAQLRSASPGSLALAAALNELCRAHEQMRATEQARAACEESMALRRAQLPPGHVDIGHIANALGVVRQESGDSDAALALFNEALAIFEAAGDDAREDVASTRHNLGYAAAKRRDFASARDEYARALAGKRALWGEDHPKTLNSLFGLALSEIGLGDIERGREVLEDLLARRIALHGADSQRVAETHVELASALQDAGDFTGAEEHYAAAESIQARIGLADSLTFAMTLNNRATLAEDRGDIALARTLYRRSYALRERLAGSTQPARVRGALNLARFQQRHPAADDASGARSTLAALPAQRAPNAIEAFDLALLDAERTWQEGDGAAARAILQHAAAPAAPTEFRRRLRRAELLALVELDAGDAARARTTYRAAFDALAERIGPNHPVHARAAVRAAMFEHAAGDDDEARRLLREALPPLRASQVDASPARRTAEAWARALDHASPGRLTPQAGF